MDGTFATLKVFFYCENDACYNHVVMVKVRKVFFCGQNGVPICIR